MSDVGAALDGAVKRLREPAALALVGYGAVNVLFNVIDLVFSQENGVDSFSQRAAHQLGFLASVPLTAVIVFGVLLAHKFGPVVERARIITIAALVELGVSLLFGVIALFGSLSANGSGDSTIEAFLIGLVGLGIVALAGWFVWTIWQAYSPSKGFNLPSRGDKQDKTQQQYPPQQQGWNQAHGQPQQAPPGGYGWQQGQQPTVQQPGYADPTQQMPAVPGQQPTGQEPAQHGQQPYQPRPYEPFQQPPQQHQHNDQQDQTQPFSIGNWTPDG